MEILGKWYKILRKWSKLRFSMFIENKQNNIWLLANMEFLFSIAAVTREVSS